MGLFSESNTYGKTSVVRRPNKWLLWNYSYNKSNTYSATSVVRFPIPNSWFFLENQI